MKNKFKRSFSVLAALALLLVSVAGVTPVSLAESIDQAYTDDSGHSQKAKKLIGEERSDSELPLSEGEITTIQSSDATFSISLNENIEPEPIENAEFIDEEEEGQCPPSGRR